MKRAFLLSFSILFLFLSCSSIPSDYTKISNDPEEKFYKINDQFTGATFIYHEYRLLNLLDSFSLYIGKYGLSSQLVANFRYSEDDWIFFDTALFVNSNNERLQISVQQNNRKVEMGYVTESGKSILQRSEIDSLRSIMSGDNVQLRLSGKYSKDYSISPEQAVSIIETIDLFIRGNY